MTHYIDKYAVVTKIKKLQAIWDGMDSDYCKGQRFAYSDILSFLNTLEVKEVGFSNISENLAEACEYLDYTSTGNLAHNKPMVSARLKKAIRSLFDAGLFELTHDKQYRMENLGLKAQKGEKV